jgi:hypothetical protein
LKFWQRQGLGLILFPQTVPKSLGSVGNYASGSFLSEAGPFPSAKSNHLIYSALSRNSQLPLPWQAFLQATVIESAENHKHAAAIHFMHL